MVSTERSQHIRLRVKVYRWGLYLLLPGRLHVVVYPWYFHACRAGSSERYPVVVKRG